MSAQERNDWVRLDEALASGAAAGQAWEETWNDDDGVKVTSGVLTADVPMNPRPNWAWTLNGRPVNSCDVCGFTKWADEPCSREHVEMNRKPTWVINGRQVELCECGRTKYVDAVCPALTTPDHGVELGESDTDDDRGVWVAYHSDGSGWVVFETEIEALRHALPNLMQVKFARFGDEDWRR